MYLIIKEKFRRTGPAVMGGRSRGINELSIDRTEKSLDAIESGEMFVKINVK